MEEENGLEELEDVGFDGARKAALVVLTLGEDVAAEVLRELTPKEIKRLSTMITDIGDVSQEVIDSILREFHQELNRGRFVMPAGGSFLENTLTKALGDELGGQMLEEIRAEMSSLDVLEDVDTRTLANILQKEHPQTAALVMAHTEVDKAAEVVASLPEDMQVEVMYRIAKLDAVSGDILHQVEQALLMEIRGLSSVGAHKAGGIKSIADILNQLDKPTETRILDRIEDLNPPMAEEVRNLMFVFEDILSIDDRGMQTLLKEVDNEQLILSLKTANDAIKAKIFRNLSQRAATMIQEDLDTMGPVRLSDVEGAQQEIVRTALRLEEEGQIVILTSGEDQFV